MNHYTLVTEFLDLRKVPYEHRVHRPAYTAQQVAEETHVSGSIVAKTVMVKVDGRSVMAVLPAPMHVDTARLRRALGAEMLRLANETEFQGLFPDSELGAMPPFGNLYGIPVYVEESLARDREIVFNAGTHQDAIRMLYDDFARLVSPQVISFALSFAA